MTQDIGTTYGLVQVTAARLGLIVSQHGRYIGRLNEEQDGTYTVYWHSPYSGTECKGSVNTMELGLEFLAEPSV